MSAKESKDRTWIVIDFRFQVDALVIIVDDILCEREFHSSKGNGVRRSYLEFPLVLIEKVNGIFDIQRRNRLEKSVLNADPFVHVEKYSLENH